MTPPRRDPYRHDVVVIGAGHAGIAAALAAARLGRATALLTIHHDAVGPMRCNPALGGAMGRLTDASAIPFRLLNRGRARLDRDGSGVGRRDPA